MTAAFTGCYSVCRLVSQVRIASQVRVHEYHIILDQYINILVSELVALNRDSSTSSLLLRSLSHCRLHLRSIAWLFSSPFGAPINTPLETWRHLGVSHTRPCIQHQHPTPTQTTPKPEPASTANQRGRGARAQAYRTIYRSTLCFRNNSRSAQPGRCETCRDGSTLLAPHCTLNTYVTLISRKLPAKRDDCGPMKGLRGEGKHWQQKVTIYSVVGA